MDGAAPTQAPTRLLEDTFAQTMKTGSAAGLPVDRIGAGAGRSIVGGSRARAGLLLVGAMLFIAFALVLAGGGPTVHPNPSPSLNRPPRLGARSTSLPATSTTITAEVTIPIPTCLARRSRGRSSGGSFQGASTASI